MASTGWCDRVMPGVSTQLLLPRLSSPHHPKPSRTRSKKPCAWAYTDAGSTARCVGARYVSAAPAAAASGKTAVAEGGRHGSRSAPTSRRA